MEFDAPTHRLLKLLIRDGGVGGGGGVGGAGGLKPSKFQAKDKKLNNQSSISELQDFKIF